jgi:hypothetical protein
LIVLAVLACSYTIGTLFDRFADLIFSKWNERLRRKIIPNPEVPIVVMRYTAAADNEYLNRLFEYTRSRLRIARASALNFPLISMGFLVYFWPRLGSHAPGLKPGIVLLVAISGVLLTGLALFSWQRLTKIYFQLVRVNYDATTSKSKPEPPGS